ncbi:MAG: hypothetical protein NE330_00775, partial [Lentisphaeraceae bacterium]|nr:hypothetical protein [Lentisphaeraceae bacterium]
GLVSGLERALKAYSTNEMPLKVLLAKPILFKVTVEIYILAGESFLDVKNKVINTLSLKYKLENSHPGNVIESSDIIATVQDIVGVSGVELQALSYIDNSEQNFASSKLRAFPAYLDTERKFNGAQILSTSPDYIDVKLGVRL